MIRSLLRNPEKLLGASFGSMSATGRPSMDVVDLAPGISADDPLPRRVVERLTVALERQRPPQPRMVHHDPDSDEEGAKPSG